MVHPAKEDLILFAEGRLADRSRTEEIRAHLAVCEFCSEYCEDQRSLQQALAEAAIEPLAPAAETLAARILAQLQSARVIVLRPLPEAETPAQFHLAADNEPAFQPGVVNLATLYSTEPEIVLRVMRDNMRKSDYLQLIGSDPTQVAHVLVQLPGLNREFITDVDGRADLPPIPDESFGRLEWQVRLPQAVFALTPLAYDPERTERENATVLTTDWGDRVEVTMQKQTEGRRVIVRVLALNGSAEYGKVRVLITQADIAEIHEAAAREATSFGSIDPQKEIVIRIFQ